MRQTSLLPEVVAIVGSREFSPLGFVRAYVSSLPPGTLVVSGGARGVDRVAEEVARARVDMPDPLIFRAAWRRPDGTLDASAGFRRNRLIVDACDRLVAFWDGRSTGTHHSIELAKDAGKFDRVYVSP